MEFKVAIDTAEKMKHCGELLGEVLRGGEVIILAGELGAGKTTLTQGIARGLGVTEGVTSPSFSLIHVHEGRLRLIHCDFYRLDSEEEIESLGFYDYILSGNVIVVEWGQLFADALPRDAIRLEIDTTVAARILRVTASRPQDVSTLKEWITRCPY